MSAADADRSQPDLDAVSYSVGGRVIMSGRKRVAGLVRPSKDGRITIPVQLREQLGIDDGTVLELSVNGDELRLRPVRERADSDWLKELYDELAPIREGMRDLSEDEVNALIDKAVAEVRRSRD